MTACKFPGCQNAAHARGLCTGHLQQEHRLQTLRPLRRAHGQVGDRPRKKVTTWIAASAHEALGPQPAAKAREVLETWARKHR